MTSTDTWSARRIAALVCVLLAGTSGPVQAQGPPVNGPIAFASDRDAGADPYALEIYTVNVDGSAVTRVSNLPNGAWSPDWSPDGSRLTFRYNATSAGPGQIYVMNADGTGVTNLSSPADNDESPAWSPDGSAIAFHSFRNGTADIYVMNADGSGQVRLTDDPAHDFNPTWSPDGTKLAFTSSRDGLAQIYVMNADGTGQTRLASSAHDHYPDWSPDGMRIAFARHAGASFDIYVMNAADGSAQTAVTTGPDHDEDPSWSPDGIYIAFVRSGDIYVMNADGSGQINITDNPATDWYPSWGPASAAPPDNDSDDDGFDDAVDACPLTPGTVNGCTPADAVDNLAGDLEALSLPAGPKQALSSTLRFAELAIERGNPTIARWGLFAFTAQVRALQRSRRLDGATAAALIDEAQAIVQSL